MSKEKQIEENELQEFVITLSDCQHRYDKECTKAIVTKTDMPKENKFYAKYLMEHGYRKQSDVAKEIIKAISAKTQQYENAMIDECHTHDYRHGYFKCRNDLLCCLLQVKEEYMKERKYEHTN